VICPETPPTTSHDAANAASRNPVVNTSRKNASGKKAGRAGACRSRRQPTPRNGAALLNPSPGQYDDSRGARRKEQDDDGEHGDVRPLGGEKPGARVAENSQPDREEEDRRHRVHPGDDHDDEGEQERRAPHRRRHRSGRRGGRPPPPPSRRPRRTSGTGSPPRPSERAGDLLVLRDQAEGQPGARGENPFEPPSSAAEERNAITPHRRMTRPPGPVHGAPPRSRGGADPRPSAPPARTGGRTRGSPPGGRTGGPGPG